MIENNNYTGWKKWTPTSDEWIEFEASKHVPPFEMKENEYLLIYSDDGLLCSQWRFFDGKLHKFGRSSIKLEREKTKEENAGGRAKEKNLVYLPRNDEQVCAFDMIKDGRTTIKLITGSWGCGKSMILVAAGLEALKAGKFEKIVWIRNNVRVKDTEDLGALPGEVNEKLLPYLGPFIDHCGEEKVITMLNHGSLEIEPLQSLRGRNLKNTLIMCSEAENLTKEHIQLIIARAAEGSEVWFDADTRQRDKASFEKSRGVETLIERLQGNQLFGYVWLVKSERSDTAALADLLS